MTSTVPVVRPEPGGDAFRSMMRDFPTGVAVVTTCDGDGQPWGMTCSSLCSVTVDPPVLLVCLRSASPTLAAVRQQEGFTVNLLHAEAQPVAELFASGAADRFDRVRWSQDDGGPGPRLVDDALVTADCEVRGLQPVGDHTLVLGAPHAIVAQGGPPPLLYGRRRYHPWPES